MDSEDNVRLWTATLDRVTTKNGRTTWDRATGEVWAETEQEARDLLAKHEPEYKIHSIKESA